MRVRARPGVVASGGPHQWHDRHDALPAVQSAARARAAGWPGWLGGHVRCMSARWGMARLGDMAMGKPHFDRHRWGWHGRRINGLEGGCCCRCHGARGGGGAGPRVAEAIASQNVCQRAWCCPLKAIASFSVPLAHRGKPHKRPALSSMLPRMCATFLLLDQLPGRLAVLAVSVRRGAWCVAPGSGCHMGRIKQGGLGGRPGRSAWARHGARLGDGVCRDTMARWLWEGCILVVTRVVAPC